MDDAELARLEHENFIDAIEIYARRRPEAVIERDGGVAVLASGVAMRLFNQVLIEDAAADPARVAAAVATMRGGSFRYVVHLRDGLDDRFVPLMAELGLSEPEGDEPMPGMALHPIGDAAAQRPELEVRQVTDAAGMDDHIRTLALGFGFAEELARAFLDASMVGVPGVRFYVGYVDGEPVSTSLGVVTGRTLGVYNVATVESARRRGYGAAMTERAALDGRADGCDVATLQASAMGRPVYEQMGYRTVVRYRGFIDP